MHALSPCEGPVKSFSISFKSHSANCERTGARKETSFFLQRFNKKKETKLENSTVTTKMNKNHALLSRWIVSTGTQEPL